jgi:DNA polymerase V
MGIHTVLDLRNTSPKEMRRYFGVVMERTCNELRGISCLALDDIAQPKQQIMSSRSFGRPVETIEELREALASYLSRAAEKLRKQQSVSAAVYVFIQTNRFNKDEQYNAGLTVPMLEPTDDTLTLTAAALAGLEVMYRSGYRYKKAGVMLTLLSDKHARQTSIFDNSVVTQRSTKLMTALDTINRDYGHGTVRSGASGFTQRWAMRNENRSPRYTTRWDELPLVY